VYSREDKRQAGSNADEGQTFLSDTYFLVSKGGTSGHHQKQSTNTLPINGLIIGKVVI